MSTQYISKIGEVRTKEGWYKEALNFYFSLNNANRSYNKLPKDWFERWVRVLELQEVHK